MNKVIQQFLFSSQASNLKNPQFLGKQKIFRPQASSLQFLGKCPQKGLVLRQVIFRSQASSQKKFSLQASPITKPQSLVKYSLVFRQVLFSSQASMFQFLGKCKKIFSLQESEFSSQASEIEKVQFLGKYQHFSAQASPRFQCLVRHPIIGSVRSNKKPKYPTKT